MGERQIRRRNKSLLVRKLAAALKANPELKPTEVIRNMSAAGEGCERNIWRCLKEAVALNEREAARAQANVVVSDEQRRLNEIAEKFRIGGVKIFLDGLSEETMRLVVGAVKEIEKRVPLTAKDAPAFTMFASAWEQYRRATQILLTEDMYVYGKGGVPFPHPANQIAKDNQAKAMRIMESYGFTLSHRESLRAFREEGELDLFAELNERYAS